MKIRVESYNDGWSVYFDSELTEETCIGSWRHDEDFGEPLADMIANLLNEMGQLIEMGQDIPVSHEEVY